MADIQLRFNKDALVLSGPVHPELVRLGTDVQRDSELTLLLEPEVFEDAYKMQQFAGAQCFVASTAGLTPARLAHAGMSEQGERLARVALDVVNAFDPQHVLAEMAPCGLPLDPSSKQSLNESCDQYKRAAKLFENLQFDAFFLNGFAKCSDLKCALMGIRKVSDAPIFASVDVNGAGDLQESEWSKPSPVGESLDEAVQVMVEYGAQVVGFSIDAASRDVVGLVEKIRKITYLPLMVQLIVRSDAADADGGLLPTPDDMFSIADVLYEAGVQFLRASGKATPAYTSVLVAATEGCDVILPSSTFSSNSGTIDGPLEDVAERLRRKVNAAIGKQQEQEPL